MALDLRLKWNVGLSYAWGRVRVGTGAGEGYFLASALDQFFSRAGGCFPDPLLIIDRPLLVRQVCAIVSVAFPRLHGCAIVVDGAASHVHAERRTTRIGGSEIDSVHVVDFALVAITRPTRDKLQALHAI